MKGIEEKSPDASPVDAGQAEAAISAQLTAVRSEKSGAGGKVYDTIIQIVLYATVILVPLLYLPWTSSFLEYNKQMILVVAAAVGLVTWLLVAVVSGKLTIRSTPVDKGILALLVVTLLATIFSKSPAESVFGLTVSLSTSLVSVLALTIFYFLVVNTVHDRGRMLRSAMLISLAFILLLGVLQMFSVHILPGSFAKTGAFNTVGSLNILGVLAAVGLALFAKSAYRGLHRALLAVSVAGVILSLLVLAILNWWVLWVIALSGMLAMIAFDSLNVTQLSDDYSGRKNRFALSRFVVPMVVIVLGAVLLLVKFNVGSLKANFPVEVAPSYGLSWHVSTSVLKQNLLFGWGPESYSNAFDRFGAGSLANSQLFGFRFFDSTSEVFTMAVQLGVLGLLALILLIWCLVQVAARFGSAISDSVSRGEGSALAAQSSGTLSATVALMVTMFIFPMNLTLWFFLYLLLALSALIVSGDRSRTVDIEERPMYSLAASLGFIVGLILVLGGLYFISVRYIADVRYAHALTQTTPQTAMDGLARAMNLDSANDRYLRDSSQVALAILREEIAKKDETEAHKQLIQNLMSSAIELAQRATTVRPDESLNWSNLGQVYQSLTGLVDNVEKLAEDSYRKASELRPGDPSFDNAIGQLWLARSDLILQVAQSATGTNAKALQQQSTDSLVNAEAAFKRAIEMSGTFGLAIYNLGAVYDRQNKVKEAIAELEKIAPFNADQPTLMLELGLLYIRDNQKDQAISALRRAVLLAPKYANARWYLALLLEEQDDIAGALLQLREIEKDNPDNKELKDKISQLDAGQRQIPPGEVIDSQPLQ